MFSAPQTTHRASRPAAREPDAAAAHSTDTASSSAATPGAGPAAGGDTQRTGHPGGEARGGRDPFFDNAKYLAIVLVAIGHAWEPVMDGSQLTRGLYLLVYVFHMPAFIVISGYFSRSFTGTPRQLRRLLTGIALPYVVFEVLYSLARRWIGGESGHPISLLDPFYLTWFLAALFVWRLTTPLWRQIRHPLPVALALAALASLTPGIGADLNLQRVLQFLPYFVLGLLLRPEHFQLLRRPEVRRLSLPVLLAAPVLACLAAPHVHFGWVYRSFSAQELQRPWWTGPLMSLVLFVAAVTLTAAFLAWVPRRRTWFTALGVGTVCGYLLHGLPLKAADWTGLFERYGWLSEPAGRVLLTVAAAAMVTLLCTPWVHRALRWATEPDMVWAFRRDALDLARGDDRGRSRSPRR
ncbi:acyltransferase family protein [Streptomyces sp. NPDC057638]|uniref:acyltransferase family protein n=1 Tax=Streptomyces sp. NPDC057638 TaxID=3346190 RepID=UPI003679B8B2